MGRLTKLEIQRALLSGETVTWTDPGGEAATLRLAKPEGRRLFAFLVGSTVRDPKGLPDDFTRRLAAAFQGADDPAELTAGAECQAGADGPWKLQTIETEGFGGLNVWGGQPFVLRLDGGSLLLQGPNGSGKSSLIGAVLWALTGERPRDHSDAKPETKAEVFDQDDRSVGSWPPIACYPKTAAQIGIQPYVRVALTFADPSGATAQVQRVLKDGTVSTTRNPRLGIPDILLETGLLMPSRMPQIRLQKGQTRLTDAVQTLAGLDELVDIGLLVDGLCHKGREYLTAIAKDLSAQKQIFDAAVAEARRVLAPVGLTVPAFEPRDTENKDGAMADLGRQINKRAAELTQVVADDLCAGLDLKSAKVQQEVIGAVTGAREDLGLGLDVLPTWKILSAIEASLSPERAAALADAASAAEQRLREVLDLDVRSSADNRLQLKALAAHWHDAHRGGNVAACPLCDQALKEQPDLANELELLRTAGEAVTRRLSDNLNAIQTALDSALPPILNRLTSDVERLAPRSQLLEDLRTRFILRERYSKPLATFVRLLTETFTSAPAQELVPDLPEQSQIPVRPEDPLTRRIAVVRRILALGEWFRTEAANWRRWWTELADPITDAVQHAPMVEGEHAAEGDDGLQRRETLSDHLDRLSTALGEAEPFRAAADALRRAWTAGQQAWSFEKEQKVREAIVATLAPLKLLGALAQAQTRQAIDDLSARIAELLIRIQVSERLRFKDARLDKKSGLVVRAGFEPTLKIDATLVANTSWLRAVLWAFLFALREEAVVQLGRDDFPLLLLDDPQATFDAEHRHRWAREIAGLQQSTSGIQVLLVTHDETFLDLIKVDGVSGREALITAAGPELGQTGIFEGASLDRKWAEAQMLNTPQAGRDYMNAVRIYVEGMLRLMLRGEGADVPTHALGDSREKISQLHRAGNAPWDKPEFSALVGQLGKGLAPIKHIEIAHHAGGVSLGMGEAVDVEEHWRRKLQPALDKGFRLAREHHLLHGGLRALQAAEPTCALPEGYQAKVSTLRLNVLGRAAALSDGRAADGHLEFSLGAASAKVVLGRHFAYRLAAQTLEPVARRGDVLLVAELGEPAPRSLVVAICEDRILARRFEISENHSDVAVLAAQTVNPHQIAPPIVVKRATLKLHKVIGVLFGMSVWTPEDRDLAEVCDCGGESELMHLTAGVLGLVEVVGQSAEPIALDGQFLLIGDAVSAEDALKRYEGRPVIARDANDDRYFKRLRRVSPSAVVLESLEISGDYPPILLSVVTGSSNELMQVWPVLGILFERPH